MAANPGRSRLSGGYRSEAPTWRLDIVELWIAVVLHPSIFSGAVAWPGEIDLAPDAMYAQIASQRDGLQHVG